MLQFNMKNAAQFVSQQEMDNLRAQMKLAQLQTLEKNGPGNDFLGWVDLPVDYDKEEFNRIKNAATRIQEHSGLLVVVGIGGSYLGARAVIELLSHHFNDYLPGNKRKFPRIVFAGNNISGAYLADLMDVLDEYSVSLNVISKSGTTTEPAIAFRILRNYMEDRYGKEAAKDRIFCTTDRNKGALKHLADQEGYETFVIPDDIGGRYSVLTAVGLLPIAVAGISIDDLMAGAAQGRERFANTSFTDNDAAQYAAARTCLMRKGYEIEILVNYEPAFHYMTEWWKQLQGESEGKDNRGLFPAGVDFSTDLHSMGQYIQAGRRILFETVVSFEDAGRTVEIPKDEANLDGLNFLAGMGMDEVNQKAMQGTVLAHVDGGVPNLAINLSERTAFSCGELIYFFEIACAFAGYLNAINPFDQPGVEAYKNNMYSLLGKPGYEEEGKKLQARIDATK